MKAHQAKTSAAIPAGRSKLAVSELGRTGLMVSQAGFGCYRISRGAAAHASALRQALSSGVNLIDTSANYADGGSEELIGDVLEALAGTGALRRKDVVVVSKSGYLQGQNYALSQERKRQGRPFPEIVPYAEGLEHCIHPEFLEDQLNRSLARLRLKTLDVCLLHNPEYFLGWSLHQGLAPSDAQAEYYRRIENAFRHLEAEVDRGRIGWYGISSNTFPAAASDPQRTCLERVWHIAERVSPDHHFAVIQFPMNLLETGAVLLPNQPSGATLLERARQLNLGVLINRPLNAFMANRLVRLAEIPAGEHPDPSHAEAAARGIAAIKAALAAADPAWGGPAPLSRLAVRALRSTLGVSCVLVGMRRIAYVEDILAELKLAVEQKDRRNSWLRLAQSLSDTARS